ncbi:MAG: HEAT repeat domain-containing protein [Promethearchaeota archaeon]
MVIEIILLFFFLIFFILGFYIIYKQVALVKKGEFRIKDRVQCIFYGIIFSLSVMVVLAVAVIYTVRTPDFWDPETTPPEVHPLVLLIPFIFCLVYITFYPMIDFLYIALSKESDEGLTPFHKFLSSKIINLSRNKILKILTAIVFYLLVFIFPPVILSILGLPLIMIWITWMLVYPLMILTFYGSKGYIAGISNAYYHIPDIRRSIFLNFENSKRGMKQFVSDPAPYIIFGLMLFVFVWAWISLIQTLMFFFTRTLVISTMTSVFVFVTLFFGILGYFTRFWQRKIKYRGIDIYFAAYLMASIGINVLVNFLIVNPKKLLYTFNLWNLTNQITPNYYMFSWAAVIEEIVLVIFTSYYFLAKNNEFIRNIRYSNITKSGQTFDPIPLFNFIKNKDPEIRKHAEESLVLMYERIPLKSEINLNEWKYRYLLIDGICDSNPNSRRICYKILIQLEEDLPDVVIPWIIEAIKSPNYDKSIPFLRSLLRIDINFLEKIPKNLLFNLIEDAEWRTRILGLKVLSRLFEKNKDLISQLNIKKLINDPNTKIQVETLKIIANNSLILPTEVIINKINHTNKEISSIAIKSLKNFEAKEFDPKLIPRFIPLLKDPSSLIRSSIFNIFAKIGNFKKYKISISPFLEGLTDPNEDVRNSAILALEKYYKERPSSLDLDSLINKIVPDNYDQLNSIIILLGKLWEFNPERILTTILNYIKFESEILQENISKILIEKYPKNPDLIFENLIKIPDVSKYITKGIISRTIIRMGKRYPNKVVQKLFSYLENENDDIRLNAILSLEGLAEEFPTIIKIKPIITLLHTDESNQIKKEASKLISEIAKNDPSLMKYFIPEFIQTFNKQDLSVKIVLSKSLLDIAKKSPDIIPVRDIINFISDSDAFIRETNTKILGLIGYKVPIPVTDVLINQALKDDEWIVREAAISSLGKIIEHVEKKEHIIEKLVPLLEDEQNWVRRTAMNILSNIKEVNENHIPFEIISLNLSSDDDKVREAAANLIRIHSNQLNEIFDTLILLLDDPSKDVRSSIINSFVNIIEKIGLNQILSKLLQNLSDEGSLEIQRSIAIILGRTVKYEGEKIKKRVMSLLKIRCEMSQDPIICSILQELKEN